jgi:hypothetical protein
MKIVPGDAWSRLLGNVVDFTYHPREKRAYSVECQLASKAPSNFGGQPSTSPR